MRCIAFSAGVWPWTGLGEAYALSSDPWDGLMGALWGGERGQHGKEVGEGMRKVMPPTVSNCWIRPCGMIRHWMPVN